MAHRRDRAHSPPRKRKMIATIPHVITPGAYASRLMTECVCRYWWAIAVPVVPCLIAGCYDLRFLIVAAAWLLIVMPGILALVYFRYALSPEAAKMTLPHIVTFADDTITVTWPDTDYPANTESRRPLGGRHRLRACRCRPRPTPPAHNTRKVIPLARRCHRSLPASQLARQEH